MSDSVRPQRWQPTRLSRPWDSPGKNTGVGCHFLLQCMKVKSESEVAQSCPTLSDPMDCSLPGSSTHGIFQARVLEWVAIASSESLYSGSKFCESEQSLHSGSKSYLFSWVPPKLIGSNLPFISQITTILISQLPDKYTKICLSDTVFDVIKF